MSETLTTAAQLQCPHGGKVQISSSNQKASASSKIATADDTFTIIGCQFKLPTPAATPSPCMKVMWVLPNFFVTVGSSKALNTSSVGLCLAATQIPQGMVMINDAGQTKVKSK